MIKNFTTKKKKKEQTKLRESDAAVFLRFDCGINATMHIKNI
jgi:hypothetical protein